jgi:hypothetical protein
VKRRLTRRLSRRMSSFRRASSTQSSPNESSSSTTMESDHHVVIEMRSVARENYGTRSGNTSNSETASAREEADVGELDASYERSSHVQTTTNPMSGALIQL